MCADRKYCSFVYCSLPLIFDNKRAFLIYKSLFKNGTKVITLLTSSVVNATLLVKVKSPGHIAADERCLLFPIQPELVAF